MPRTIAVVTGSRADFGLLTSVMRAVDAHPKLRLRTVVAGLHFVMNTRRDVRAAGFDIDAEVRMQVRGHSGRAADMRALGRGVERFGALFDALKPDVVLVLGDRIEAFAAAAAASVGGIRVGHIHGGDRAEGVADEAMRHAVTKLAHLHFPATKTSRKRILRMGEHEAHVFNVGSPAIDGLRDTPRHRQPDSHRQEPGVADAADAAADIVVLQHPIGDGDATEQRHMRETMLAAQDAARRHGLARIVYLAPNSDPGHAGIRNAIGDRIAPHMPRPCFLDMLRAARVLVGNSSAGLIEAAALKVPCVNIGPRQNGREKPANVIDCDYGRDPVLRAIREAISLDLSRMRQPYGDGRTGERIAEVLATVDLNAVPVRKRNAY